MRFTYFFLPKGSTTLDAATYRRLPYLVGMNFLLLAFFFLSSLMRYLSNTAVYGTFFEAICASELFFVLSLVLLKSRQPLASSYVGTLGILSTLF